ncbi:hypothetical protein [Devosia sp.]|uniref:hypothetical protein n=1 Tax=Devosia sp. TaxID=1871048 RepID=UPI002F01F42B
MVAMTSVAVAILDRDDWAANTDIIVVADAKRRRLTWVPRDLWSPLLNDRINAAFRQGGGARLLEALGQLGFPCDSVLCLRRAATEAALAGADVTVPVERSQAFWYPLWPTEPIENGRKLVEFRAPGERLQGERIHQWIGARHAVAGDGSDLMRLARQRTLLLALLRQGVDFGQLLRDPDLVRMFGPDSRATLAQVDETWAMRVFADVLPETIDGKHVLVRANTLQRLLHRLRLSVRHRVGTILGR